MKAVLLGLLALSWSVVWSFTPVSIGRPTANNNWKQESRTSRLFAVEPHPGLEQNETKVVGIGGLNGVTYDVNRLKRNLVQEALQKYKRELWDLLGTPASDLDEIETKLAALVQTNPVSTTTDSNLLDGQWTFAFGSSQRGDVLLDKDRFVLEHKLERRRKERPKKEKKNENPIRSTSRLFQLEEEQHHPSMVDEVHFLGGIVTKSRKYNVKGLTRTHLDMEIAERGLALCGRKIWKRQYEPETRNSLEIKVLYLDPDLCVSTTRTTNHKSLNQDHGPFQVYTKDDAWVDRKARVKRTVKSSLFTFRWVNTLPRKVLSKLLFSRLVQDSSSLSSRNGNHSEKTSNTTITPIVVKKEQAGGNSKLTVVKLGDLEQESTFTEKSWGSETDPFVHLSSMERQAHLKQMSLGQVERAKRREERRKRGKKRPMLRRIKTFRKPKADE